MTPSPISNTATALKEFAHMRILRLSVAHGRRVLAPALFAAGLLGSTACSDMLTVSDPTAIQESQIGTERIAVSFWRAALDRLDVISEAVRETGMLTDEFFWNASNQDINYVYPSNGYVADKRDVTRYLALTSSGGGLQTYSGWQELRLLATVATRKLMPFSAKADHRVQLGELYALRGLAALRLAQNVCPGFPLNDIDAQYGPVFGPPLTTTQVLERALVDFDSAAIYAADSARILDFVRVGRASVLVELGRYSDAATAATAVPDGYTYTGQVVRPLGEYGSTERSVSDKEGSNGLDFVSAHDPRVETTYIGMANNGVDSLFDIVRYMTGPDNNGATPLVLLSGVEARLIEAEAALNEHPDDGAWLDILNHLRATAVTPALDDLDDPATTTERIDLLYRERAFWLFATDHRLGDLRRLMRVYGRAPETLFPTGTYRTGGPYGPMTSLPFPASLEAINNPAITGCTGP
jgi:starch-binding outer membrane protein, SusD/RagB family